MPVKASVPQVISERAYSWKRSSNIDKNKKAQEVVFSWKQSQPIKALVAYSCSQKHVGLILDEKLSFTNHIKVKIHISGTEINVIKSLNKILPRYCNL